MKQIRVHIEPEWDEVLALVKKQEGITKEGQIRLAIKTYVKKKLNAIEKDSRTDR